MTTLELEKLKTALPVGYLDLLSVSTEFSRSYICQVLNGERNNVQIIDAAIELAKEEKAIREARSAEIANL
ncbi:MAG: hypothetical protein ACOYN4_00430 [Bacteroidales bacterium]